MKEIDSRSSHHRSRHGTRSSSRDRDRDRNRERRDRDRVDRERDRDKDRDRYRNRDRDRDYNSRRYRSKSPSTHSRGSISKRKKSKKSKKHHRRSSSSDSSRSSYSTDSSRDSRVSSTSRSSRTSKKSSSRSRYTRANSSEGNSNSMPAPATAPAKPIDLNDCKVKAALETIDEDEFVPKSFYSTRDREAPPKPGDKVIINLDKETVSLQKTSQPLDLDVNDDMFHPNFLGDAQQKMDRWIKKLYNYRQKCFRE